MIRQLPKSASEAVGGNFASRDESPLLRDEIPARLDEVRIRHAAPLQTPPPLPIAACYLPGRNAQYCSRNPRFLRLTWSARAIPRTGGGPARELPMIPPSASRDHARRRHRSARAHAASLRRCAGRRSCWSATALGHGLVGARLAVHARARPAGRLVALARHPQHQLLVHLGALHAGHRLAVAALPVRAPRRCGARCSSISRRSRCSRSVTSLAMSARPASGWRRSPASRSVRWKDVQPLDAPELRLGNDHLLGHRRPEPRRLVLPRVARSRGADGAARDAAGRSAARGAAAPAAARTSSSTRCTRSRR